MNRWAGFVFLLGGLALVGLFFILKPAPQPIASAAELPAQAFAFTINDGQLIDGPDRVSVPEGTPVTLRFFASEHDEAHLHGYDLKAKLEPGEFAEIYFVADKSGRFEVELHKSHATLFAVEVHPR